MSQERHRKKRAPGVVWALAVTAAMALSGGYAAAADLEVGLKAYEAGDYQAARAELQPIAEQGNAIAQYKLGHMHRYGNGVPQDVAEAIRWYQIAAEQGHTDAQYSLGYMYHTGEGVPQDDAEVARWWGMAAEQGDAEAARGLGFYYDTGKGVPQDYAEAVRWWRMAAEHGDAIAQRELGVMYETGRGVLASNVTAHVWFNIAGANGYDTARENRDALAKNMTPQEISEAQRRAQVCMSSGYQDCD